MRADEAAADVLKVRAEGAGRKGCGFLADAGEAAFGVCDQVAAAELVLVEQLDGVAGLHQRIAGGVGAQYGEQLVHISAH